MNPCKDCEKRFVRVNDEGKVERCDSTCEEYKAWKAENKEKKDALKKDKNAWGLIADGKAKRRQNWKKRWRGV